MPRRILYVYILASNTRSLYVGVTNNLSRRLWEHRQPRTDLWAFVARHRTVSLVYYESFEGALPAIRREKQIKGWRRLRKLELIERVNPEWDDLSLKALLPGRTLVG